MKKVLTSPRYVMLSLLVFAFILYGNTLGHDFTLDDAIVITDNEFTQKGFAGLKDIFSKDTFHGFFGEAGKDKLVSGGRYRPFTLAMFAIEHAIFGQSPFIHHLINVLLYGFLGILIYLLGSRLLESRFDQPKANMLAVVIALLYLAHPIHTEAVANIKGRDEIMAMLCSIAALFIMVRKPIHALRIKDYAFAALVFLAGLLSKENAITFVVVAPLAAFVFHKRSAKIAIPFLLSGFIFMIIRTAVIGFDMGAAPSGEFMNNPYLKIEGGQYVPFTPFEKLATIAHTLWKYVQLLLIPWPLTHDYYPNHIELKTFSSPSSLLGIILYLTLAVVSFLGLLKRKSWAFFVSYYLITISIASNIVFPIGTHMSERFVFMPSLGFAGIMSLLLFKWNHRMGWIITTIILTLYTIGTVTRNTTWKDNYTLFTKDALTSAKSAKVNNAAGGAISDHIKEMPASAERQKLIEQGLQHLDNAISVHPNYINAYLLKGNLYFYSDRYEEALQMYAQCLRIDPGYQDAIRNKFLALRAAGRYYGEKMNNLPKSAEFLEQAVRLEPNDFETNRLLGTCYGIMGIHQQAAKYFKKCSELQPNNAAIFVNLAKAYEFLGNEDLANKAAARARELGAN